jgi:hypothetical protein
MLALQEEVNLYSRTLIYFAFLFTVAGGELIELSESRRAKE